MSTGAKKRSRSSGAERWSGLGCALLLAGCGGSPPPEPEHAEASAPAEADAKPRGSGIAVQSEVGALDERKVKATFERVSPKMIACFHKGAQRIPFLSGDVRFVIRVSPDGSARAVYAKESTLGDRDTEQCMMGALKSASWPKPVGGEEGIAENNFSFDPGDGERPPVAWAPEQLGKEYNKARGALSKCRSSAGAGPLTVTLYVETDGKPLAVGVAMSDEKGEGAAQCVVDALKGMTFPSPGSYASKVTVHVD